MSTLHNYTYDEISIGQTATYSKTLLEDDLVLFATTSGDVNPVHLDKEFAEKTQFKERIGHGAWTGSVISAAIALKLPGPGTVYIGQNLTFRLPVKIGDTIVVHLEVTEKRNVKKIVTLACKAINQHDKTVAKGTANVIAPSEKLKLPIPNLPNIKIG